MSPVGVQMRRARGWRKPDGVIVVDRRTKWGNPFKVKVNTPTPDNATAVSQLATLIVMREIGFLLPSRPPYPSRTEIVAELGGRDLGCACALNETCHRDLLLTIANEIDIGPYASLLRAARAEFARQFAAVLL